MPPHAKHELIFAPQPYEHAHAQPIVFLSGTVLAAPASNDNESQTFSTWRIHLTTTLSYLPITLLNPHRPDWDHTWITDISFPPFKEQVTWELNGMEAADIIAIFFDEGTAAPITLLEFGLFVGRKAEKCVVGVAKGYSRKGNVQVVCERFGVELVDSKEELADAVVRRVEVLGVATL